MSHHEQYDLENEIRQLEVQALNFAARFTKDAHARQQYTRATRNFVRELRAAHVAGRITAAHAAETAH